MGCFSGKVWMRTTLCNPFVSLRTACSLSAMHSDYPVLQHVFTVLAVCGETSFPWEFCSWTGRWARLSRVAVSWATSSLRPNTACSFLVSSGLYPNDDSKDCSRSHVGWLLSRNILPFQCLMAQSETMRNSENCSAVQIHPSGFIIQNL